MSADGLEKIESSNNGEPSNKGEALKDISNKTSEDTSNILSIDYSNQVDTHLNAFQDPEIREIMTIIFKTQVHAELFNQYLEEYGTDESKQWLIHLFDVTTKVAQGGSIHTTSIKGYYDLIEDEVKDMINNINFTSEGSFDVHIGVLDENINKKDWMNDILMNKESAYREGFTILGHRLKIAQMLIQKMNKGIHGKNISKYFEFLSMGIEK